MDNSECTKNCLNVLDCEHNDLHLFKNGDYYCIDKFINSFNKISISDINENKLFLSILHLNAKSLLPKMDDLNIILQSLKFKFNIIAVRRRVDICCVQETQYKGEGSTVFGEREEGYKFLWMGEKDKRGGVRILITEVEEGNRGGKKNIH